MSSFKDNTIASFRSELSAAADNEMLSAWDMKDQFDQYLAKKLEENDMVSYFIINELYRFYLTSLNRVRPAKVIRET